jgi:adenylate kinase
MFVLAIVGLSGVGKSTLIGQFEKELPLRHFTASELIKSELALRESQVATSEELRLGPVVDNQILLGSAFARRTEGLEGPVVLDGHVVIDGASGLVDIPASVFGGLGVQHMLFIRASADEVAERRQKDALRARPQRTITEITAHQEHALRRAKTITGQLGIPLAVLDVSNKEAICQLSISLRNLSI